MSGPARVRDTAGLAAWLRLTFVAGLGGETQRRLLKTFGLPEAVFAAGAGPLAQALGADAAQRLLGQDSRVEIDAALAWADQAGNHIVTLADPDYPQALLASADPPILLYAKGRRELLDRAALAIVGSRNATRQGETNAHDFAAAFSAAGLTVISGLALGIDAAAHRGALEGEGSTVAVIGTGVDRIYPARNEPLARQIAEVGCIVSEFSLGTPALPANFPRRNRIIAGMSRGCLVVEAAARSGSLITARLAADAGREVFAIPGSIHSPLARGCHTLIRQGAKLVESAQDVLEELRWEARVAPVPRPATDADPGDDPGADATLLQALGWEACDLDTLSGRTGLTPERLIAMLLPMELDGHVAQLPGGLYQRVQRRP